MHDKHYWNFSQNYVTECGMNGEGCFDLRIYNIPAPKSHFVGRLSQTSVEHSARMWPTTFAVRRGILSRGTEFVRVKSRHRYTAWRHWKLTEQVVRPCVCLHDPPPPCHNNRELGREINMCVCVCVCLDITANWRALAYYGDLFTQILETFSTFKRISQTEGEGGWPAARPVPEQDNTTEKDTGTHSCLEWNSNLWSQSYCDQDPGINEVIIFVSRHTIN